MWEGGMVRGWPKYRARRGGSLVPPRTFSVHGVAGDSGWANSVRKHTEEGEEFLRINPKGKVAALRLEDESVLTENIAILLYIADRAPQGRLAPAPVSRAYFELVQWLTFISSELHKQCLYPVFRPDAPRNAQSLVHGHLNEVLAILNQQLQVQSFLAGAEFSVADAYLLWGLLLAGPAGARLEDYPAVNAYLQRLRARPSVVESLKAESEANKRADPDLSKRRR